MRINLRDETPSKVFFVLYLNRPRIWIPTDTFCQIRKYVCVSWFIFELQEVWSLEVIKGYLIQKVKIGEYILDLCR